METLNQIKDGKHWNATVLKETVVGGLVARQLEVHGGWVNYLDVNGDWQPIDCNYIATPTGFDVTKAPFNFHAPKFADEVATFESTVRFDVVTKSQILEPSMSQTLKALDAAHVQGQLFDFDGNGRTDAILYPQAFPQWNADLIYFVHHGRAPRLKKLVRFNSVLPSDIQVNFELTYGQSPIFVKREKNKSNTTWDEKQKVTSKDGFNVSSVTGKRGIGMKEFTIWDSGKSLARKKSQIDVDLQKTGPQKYKLTKKIPSSFFPGALFPVFTDTTTTFYPDPNVEVTSVDGHVHEIVSAEAWATAHDKATGTGVDDSGTTVTTVCDAAAGAGGYRIARLFFLFDTSALTSAAVISAATFSFAFDALGGSGHNDTAQTFGLVQTTPASNTALSTADIDAVTLHTDTNGSSSTPAVNATTSAGVYIDFPLSATGMGWISKTAITKLGVRRSPDYLDSVSHTLAPSAVTQSHRDFRSADFTGTSSDPTLVITFTIPVNPFFGQRVLRQAPNRASTY